MDIRVDYFHDTKTFRAVIAGCHGHWGASEGSPMGYGKTADTAIEIAWKNYDSADVITSGRHCYRSCPEYNPFD